MRVLENLGKQGITSSKNKYVKNVSCFFLNVPKDMVSSEFIENIQTSFKSHGCSFNKELYCEEGFVGLFSAENQNANYRILYAKQKDNKVKLYIKQKLNPTQQDS